MEILVTVLAVIVIAAPVYLYRRRKAVETLCTQTADDSEFKKDNSQDSETDPKEMSGSDREEDKTVTQNAELIAALHRVFEEEKIFLRPDVHIDDVAQILFTNRTYVTRLMRQEYGLSFIEYVNVARIQYSQSLLYTTNMTLDEVAVLSGFQSTSSYCRAFKRYMGTSPVAWKNSLPAK